MLTNSKLLLGTCTFLPFIFGAIFLVYYILALKELFSMMPVDDPQLVAHWYFTRVFSGTLLFLIVGAIITHISLMIWYILHVVKHGTKTEGEKVMWILLFVFIGTIPFIIYYFLKIVPETGKKTDMQIS